MNGMLNAAPGSQPCRPDYNSSMRLRLSQVVAFAFLWPEFLCSQEAILSGVPCPASSKPTASSEFHIAQVTFLGSLSLAAQQQIANVIKRDAKGSTVEHATESAVDIARASLQNRGYFKALADSEGATINSIPPRTIAVTIRVEEGGRYHLGAITFQNNRAVANVVALRNLFPIKDGDVFSREKIATGIDQLRSAYTELGYIYFTSIPNTTFDEERKLIFLDVDMDEGMQFVVRSINILGVSKTSEQQILQDSPLRAGQIYNSRLLRLLIERHPATFKFASDDPAHIWRDLDERSGTVAITLDVRACTPH